MSGKFWKSVCWAHQIISCRQCQVGFEKVFAELIKISRVDSASSVLIRFCRAHQNILCGQCQVGYQSSNSERSDLRFEAWKTVFVKRDVGVYIIFISGEICKPIWKLDFTAHGIMESLSEFGLKVCKAHQKILCGHCGGRFNKEFAELIKICHVDNVRSLL